MLLYNIHYIYIIYKKYKYILYNPQKKNYKQKYNMGINDYMSFLVFYTLLLYQIAGKRT